ncbi:MAG: hypothetical protein KDJ38_10570, partial [Gammaproteobacteria bacterium]|nr:hypothetical protein [Gammaproteobacteria bacterium]
MSLRFFVLLAALLFTLSPSAEILDSRLLQPSPRENWQTLKTPHFNVHFIRRHEAYARRIAEIAERQFPLLTEKLRWTPHGKTEIVVNDTVDVSNGGSTVYPYNRFYVYMNEPVDGELLDQADFAETLFIHEFTHILQLDQVGGAPSSLRSLFGKSPDPLLSVFVLPQVFAPHWLSEGIAIRSESLDGNGRNNNAMYEGRMREEVLKGLASFSAESYEGYYNSRWPFGQVYLYGAYFFQFLEERYGEQVVTDYIVDYRNNLLPWQMNKRALQATGKDARQLWTEFQDYLRKRFEPAIEEIKLRGLTRGEILYAERWSNRLLTAGPDGSVFFYHDERKNPPRILQLFPDGKVKEVAAIKGLSSMRWHPQAGLLLAKPQVCGNTALYTDLFRFDLNHSRLERITNCARIARADWAKDGKSAYAVQTLGGRNNLLSVSANGAIEILDELAPGEAIGQPEVSADGKTVLAAVKRQGQGWNIESFDIVARRWTALTQGGALESMPFYFADGRHIGFLSDHDGQLELRSLDPQSGDIRSLTNSTGYVNQAVQSDDGRLWISEYTGQGDVIRRLAPELRTGEPLSTDTMQAVGLHEKSLPEVMLNAASSPYNPWLTLTPRGWAPVFLADSDFWAFGLQLAGQDILGFHQWSLMPVYYDFRETQHTGGALSYSFNDRLLLSASSDLQVSYQSGEPDQPEYYDTQDNIQLLARYPLNRYEWAMDFSAGIARERTRRSRIAEQTRSTQHDTIAGFGITFNNFDRYPLASTRGSGLGFDLLVESFDWSGAKNDHQGEAAVFRSVANLRFAEDQTLIANLDAGAGETNGKPFRLGGSVDSVDSLGGITRLGERDFALRGYSANEKLAGKQFLRASLAWHFPLASIYDGWLTPPIGLGRLKGNLFTEAGDAWNSTADRTFYPSVGAELSGEILL